LRDLFVPLLEGDDKVHTRDTLTHRHTAKEALSMALFFQPLAREIEIAARGRTSSIENIYT